MQVKPNHSNKVVIEDWYSNDELLTQYVSDWGFKSAFALYVGFGVLMTSKLGTIVILMRYVAAITHYALSNGFIFVFEFRIHRTIKRDANLVVLRKI